jgi:hypothetical protein
MVKLGYWILFLWKDNIKMDKTTNFETYFASDFYVLYVRLQSSVGRHSLTECRIELISAIQYHPFPCIIPLTVPVWSYWLHLVCYPTTPPADTESVGGSLALFTAAPAYSGALDGKYMMQTFHNVCMYALHGPISLNPRYMHTHVRRCVL